MSYSDEQKAIALAALQANGGNLIKTAKFVGIPESTIRHWRNGEHPPPAKIGDKKKVDLSDMFEKVVRDILGTITIDDITDAKLSERMTSAGIGTDKMRLLREQPTSIEKNEYSDIPDTELDKRIEALERGETKTTGEKPELLQV